MILKNRRHEVFSQAIATGMSLVDAYRLTYGPGKKHVDSLSSRLAATPGVKARVSELQQIAARGAVMTLRERREFLAEVVRCSVATLPADSPLIQTIKKTIRKGRGKADVEEVIEYRLPDKRACIELDAKLSGELTEQLEVRMKMPPDVVLEAVRTMSPILTSLGTKASTSTRSSSS